MLQLPSELIFCQSNFHIVKIKKAIKGFWKFNNSLIENEEYVHQMKKFIPDTLNELFNEKVLDDQVKSEYLKYNIRKYTINFSKKTAKNTNKKIVDLETKLKHFEKYYENYVDNIDSSL